MALGLQILNITSPQKQMMSRIYVEALTAMEKAAAANGFDDISVALFGSLAGGDRALYSNKKPSIPAQRQKI